MHASVHTHTPVVMHKRSTLCTNACISIKHGCEGHVRARGGCVRVAPNISLRLIPARRIRCMFRAQRASHLSWKFAVIHRGFTYSAGKPSQAKPSQAVRCRASARRLSVQPFRPKRRVTTAAESEWHSAVLGLHRVWCGHERLRTAPTVSCYRPSHVARRNLPP